MRLSRIMLIALLFFSNCENFEKKVKKQREISYFSNGILKHEVLLLDGKREGIGLEYFDDGKIKAKAFYVDGEIEGKSVSYYQNGNIRQENQYDSETKSCISKHYTEDGFLDQITELDSNRNIMNYFSYKKDGSRDFSDGTKSAIFITKSDTVKLGENYMTEIKLGNRQFKIVTVTIGNTNDRSILKKNPPLPKKDSLTSILTLKTDSLGLNTIEGAILERNEKMDSFDVVLFEHSFFVRP